MEVIQVCSASTLRGFHVLCHTPIKYCCCTRACCLLPWLFHGYCPECNIPERKQDDILLCRRGTKIEPERPGSAGHAWDCHPVWVCLLFRVKWLWKQHLDLWTTVTAKSRTAGLTKEHKNVQSSCFSRRLSNDLPSSFHSGSAVTPAAFVARIKWPGNNSQTLRIV